MSDSYSKRFGLVSRPELWSQLRSGGQNFGFERSRRQNIGFGLGLSLGLGFDLGLSPGLGLRGLIWLSVWVSRIRTRSLVFGLV